MEMSQARRKRSRNLYEEDDEDGGGEDYDDNSGGEKKNGSKGHGLMLALVTIPLAIQVTLLCVLMFVLTYYYTKAHSCVNNREVWCKDDWYCNKQTPSTDKVYSKCYQSKDHLASCLFGPKSTAAVQCIDFSKEGVACPTEFYIRVTF